MSECLKSWDSVLNCPSPSDWSSHSPHLYVSEIVCILLCNQSDMNHVKPMGGSFSSSSIGDLSSEQVIVGLVILHLKLSIFVPVNKCKYICIYGKIPFEDVHKFRRLLGAVSLVREAK